MARKRRARRTRRKSPVRRKRRSRVDGRIALWSVVFIGLGLFLLKDFVFTERTPRPKLPLPPSIASKASAPVEAPPKPAPKPVLREEPPPEPVSVKKIQPAPAAPKPKSSEPRKKFVISGQAKPPAPKPAPLPAEPARPVYTPPPPAAKKANMAIILDDWGNNYSVLKDALSIGRPLTLAILPKLPYSRRISEEAYRGGLGVMLHMPMQPRGKAPLEPQTILTTSPDTEIQRYLEEALASLSYVEGVNNHMGSAATSDERVMRAVMTRLREKNLYYVDSNTIAESVCEKIASEVGIRFQKRDVFIDNEPDLESIKRQLRQARDVALETGEVVVIGHDKKVTLQAIRETVPELEKAGIRLVHVAEILDRT